MYQVPSYNSYEFDEKHNKYCVCVFVINEGVKFLTQLDSMANYSDRIDIVVADGGSSDGSTEHKGLMSRSVNTLLVKKGQGKLGSQMRMAFAWALERGYEGVVVIDGNGKDDVSAIPSFVDALNAGFDHVQGSRFIKGGYHENTPLSRLLGVKLLHAPLLSLFSGYRYTDTTNGFRAYSKALLSSSGLDLFRNKFLGYELHYYLALMAPKLGFLCKELPVTRKYPAEGKVPTKISPIKGSLQVIRLLFNVCVGKYAPQKLNEPGDALIGYTGFVGKNLNDQREFQYSFNSKNISDIQKKTFNTLFISGVSAVKWLANKEPEKDLKGIEGLLGNLSTIESVDRVVLISTVDVYPNPIGVDESSFIDKSKQHAYGGNRLYFEEKVVELFGKDKVFIVRLPALFGPYLKKNIVYDFLNDNQVESIDSSGTFQFYDLRSLSADIDKMLENNIHLLNFAVEPVSVKEVARVILEKEFENDLGNQLLYDFRSVNSKPWGGYDYLYSRQQVIDSLTDYVNKVKKNEF